jgi:hypothetical protein
MRNRGTGEIFLGFSRKSRKIFPLGTISTKSNFLQLGGSVHFLLGCSVGPFFAEKIGFKGTVAQDFLSEFAGLSLSLLGSM